MGKSIARRLGSGKTVLLADFNDSALAAAAAELRTDGYAVRTQTVMSPTRSPYRHWR